MQMAAIPVMYCKDAALMSVFNGYSFVCNVWRVMASIRESLDGFENIKMNLLFVSRILIYFVYLFNKGYDK